MSDPIGPEVISTVSEEPQKTEVTGPQPEKKVFGLADFHEYLNVRSRLDEFLNTIAKKHVREIVCKGGCSQCCDSEPLLLPIEYAYLKFRLKMGGVVYSGSETCRFAAEKCCSPEAERPLFCRIKGYPQWIRVGYTKGYRAVCPSNFTGRVKIDTLPQEDLLDIERVKTLLAKLNLDFCERFKIEHKNSELPFHYIFEEQEYL